MRLLLAAGADPQQETSRGRLPEDFAREAVSGRQDRGAKVAVARPAFKGCGVGCGCEVGVWDGWGFYLGPPARCPFYRFFFGWGWYPYSSLSTGGASLPGRVGGDFLCITQSGTLFPTLKVDRAGPTKRKARRPARRC